MNAPLLYPSRTRREVAIRELIPGKAAWIAGRLQPSKEGGFILADATGALPLVLEEKVSFSGGDLVEVRGVLDPSGGFTVSEGRTLCSGRTAPPPGSPNEALWRMPRDLFDRRRKMKDALRSFFIAQEFIEVESPCLVRAPGQEPHLDPFRTGLDDGKGGQEMFLITSPEYFHKRLLAAGFEKIFEVARVFRNGPSEMAGLHNNEFFMVEWYRAFASYLEIMEDTEGLVHALAKEARHGTIELFEPPFERLSMRDAFHRFAGVDLEPFLRHDPAFALAAAANGDHGIMPGDSLNQRFFKIFIGAVEPELGRPRPVFLIDFPAAHASLSKIREDQPDVCERFELYIQGVELANGFTELNDPEEQRKRFEAEERERAERGGDPVPQDEYFMEALHLGMPPSGGVALGLDRLFMVLHGQEDISSALPFVHETGVRS